MIGFITVEVLPPSATGNGILIDSDDKIQMQYVVSNPDRNVGGGTQGTMFVTLTASVTSGFVAI